MSVECELCGADAQTYVMPDGLNYAVCSACIAKGVTVEQLQSNRLRGLDKLPPELAAMFARFRNEQVAQASGETVERVGDRNTIQRWRRYVAQALDRIDDRDIYERSILKSDLERLAQVLDLLAAVLT